MTQRTRVHGLSRQPRGPAALGGSVPDSPDSRSLPVCDARRHSSCALRLMTNAEIGERTAAPRQVFEVQQASGSYLGWMYFGGPPASGVAVRPFE